MPIHYTDPSVEEKKQANLAIQNNTPFPSEGNEMAQSNFIEALLAGNEFLQKENINNQSQANLKALHDILKSEEEIKKHRRDTRYYSLFKIVKHKHIVQRFERPFSQLKSTQEQEDFMCDLLFRENDLSSENKLTIINAQNESGVANIIAMHELLVRMNRIHPDPKIQGKLFQDNYFCKYILELLTPKEEMSPAKTPAQPLTKTPENEEKKEINRSLTASSPEKPMTEEDALQQALHDPMTIDENTLQCTISGLQFVDPVVTADGHIYERSAIEEWFSTGSQTSPNTGVALENTKLFDFHLLKKIITRGNGEQGYTITAADLICPLAERFMCEPELAENGILYETHQNVFKRRKVIWLNNIIDKLLTQHHALLTSDQRNNMLYWGILSDDTNKVEQALRWGADPNATVHGMHLLEQTATDNEIKGNLKLVQMLLKAGAKPTPSLIEIVKKCSIKNNKQEILNALQNTSAITQSKSTVAAPSQLIRRRDEEKIAYEQEQARICEDITNRLCMGATKFFLLTAREKKILIDQLIALTNDEMRERYLSGLINVDPHVLVDISNECEQSAELYATTDLNLLAAHLQNLRIKQVNAINLDGIKFCASCFRWLTPERQRITVYDLLMLAEDYSIEIIDATLTRSIQNVEEISQLIRVVVAENNFSDSIKNRAQRVLNYAIEVRDKAARDKIQQEEIKREEEKRQVQAIAQSTVDRIEGFKRIAANPSNPMPSTPVPLRQEAYRLNENSAAITDTLGAKFGIRPFSVPNDNEGISAMFECNSINRSAFLTLVSNELLQIASDTHSYVRGEQKFHITVRIPSIKIAEYSAQHIAQNIEIHRNLLASLRGYQTHFQDPSYRIFKKIFLQAPTNKNNQVQGLINLLSNHEPGYDTVSSQLNEARYRCLINNTATQLRTNRNGKILQGIKWITSPFGFFSPTRAEGESIADLIDALPRSRR